MTININFGGLGPFAKALTPAILALLGAVANSLITGKIDQQSLVIAITGVVAAIVTYVVPNASKPAPPSPTPVVLPPKA